MLTHNGANWLEEQIRSITAQSSVQVSLHIFDDCSTDDTQQLLHALTSENHNVFRYRFDHPSGSSGKAFLKAFKACDIKTFDYVALADQDDIWLREKLSRAIGELAKHPHAVGYSCSALAFWSNGKTKHLHQNPHMKRLDYLFEGAGQGCTFVLRARFFREAQSLIAGHLPLFESFHYHDWLLYLIARAKDYAWIFDRTPWILYRQHGLNELGGRGTARAFVKRVNLIKSGWYRTQVATAAQIAALVAQDVPSVYLTSFCKILFSPHTMTRRVKVALFSLVNGRRRLSERLFVAVCALIGWI